jgi:hypothetical protein
MPASIHHRTSIAADGISFPGIIGTKPSAFQTKSANTCGIPDRLTGKHWTQICFPANMPDG